MIWRPILDAPGYEVSDQGDVRSLDRQIKHGDRTRFAPGRVLKPGRHPFGYRQVKIGGGTRMVHDLVLTAFVGARPVGMECRHLNGDPWDSRLVNLAWGTHAENLADKVVHGTDNCGERNHRARLTAAQAAAIRVAVDGGEQRAAVAQRFGISRQTVRDIAQRITWQHLERP